MSSESSSHIAPYCSSCGQLRKWAAATGQYDNSQSRHSYPSGVPEKYCSSCGLICPYRPTPLVHNELEYCPNLSASQSEINADSSRYISTGTQISSSHALQKSSGLVSTSNQSKPFSTYHAYDDIVKAAYRPTSQLIVGKGIPVRRKHGKNLNPTKLLLPIDPTPTVLSIFERKIRLVYRYHQDPAHKIFDLPGSETWRPTNELLDMPILDGEYAWTQILEIYLLKQTGLYNEFVNIWWSEDPDNRDMPSIERITIFSSWGRKKGGDRLPEFEYKTKNNTLRHVISSYFPVDKKGLARPVYLYAEYSFPLREMHDSEQEKTYEMPNKTSSLQKKSIVYSSSSLKLHNIGPNVDKETEEENYSLSSDSEEEITCKSINSSTEELNEEDSSLPPSIAKNQDEVIYEALSQCSISSDLPTIRISSSPPPVIPRPATQITVPVAISQLSGYATRSKRTYSQVEVGTSQSSSNSLTSQAIGVKRTRSVKKITSED